MLSKLVGIFVALVVAPVLLAADLDWPVFGGNKLHQRHTTATQISLDNVDNLQLAWEYDTGIAATFQATPIVQQGVMYLSLPFNDVVALDAISGKEIWRYHHDRNKDYNMCCGPANRGVAVSEGKVFMGTVDARLLALDAKTGKKLWDIDVVQGEFGIQEDIASLNDHGEQHVSGTSGAGLNMAPMVYKGKVIVGITGVGYGLHLNSPDPDAPLGAVVGIAGKYGRRGFLAAYDMNSGERKWKFDTISSQGWEGDFTAETADGIKLPRNIEKEKADLNQYQDAWRYGGGSAWSTPAIDHETGLLYFGTGNPSPQMEGSSRPGDNLYSVSLVALDANSGEYKWHYQQVPHDMWGYDVASPPVLYTATIDGKEVPVVGQAGKTGWFYVHHRSTGELLFKSEAFVPQSNLFSLASREGTVIYPGVFGGANWSPVSVDEQRRLVFIAGVHWPVTYTLHERAETADKPALRYSSMAPVTTGSQYGILSAVNIDSGKLVWQHQTPNPLLGGILSTQTGLVFSGEGGGELFAVDAMTGEKKWAGGAEAGVNAPPISYSIDGKQYIAVAAGGNKLFGYKSGQKLMVWALP
ncbi:MAG: pyrrolo-quinoline quinone [Gammaproteobacteria bacterium]|nr:MAG: pyrrolo-quinoline quinone [Gammaproteobacteria bacterium]